MRFRRNELWELIRPFDDRDTVTEKILIQAKPLGRPAIFDPKKIEVINRDAAAVVLVHQSKRRTRDWDARANFRDQPFNELRLAGAERPD